MASNMDTTGTSTVGGKKSSTRILKTLKETAAEQYSKAVNSLSGDRADSFDLITTASNDLGKLSVHTHAAVIRSFDPDFLSARRVRVSGAMLAEPSA